MMATRAPGQVGLFGGIEPPQTYAPKVISPKASGYAAAPGSGPEHETCGSCAHCRLRRGQRQGGQTKRYYKCVLMIAPWTFGRASDVLLKSPACKRWQPGTPQETHVSRVHNPNWTD